MKIAFLGLGNMGSHMAGHLHHAGHDVTVWNRTLSKADGLRAQGAKVGKSTGETVKDAEAVITMLADDHAVESAVLHSGGVLDHLPRGAVHISMSTISVALSQKLAEDHNKRGQQYIAAPVFGRPEAAEAGKLFVVAAGDKSAVERCKPLLEVLGQRVFVIGDKPEMANVVKLSGNFLIASVIESLGEAIALTRKYGIDPHAYVEFLTNSLFAAPVYKTYGGIIAEEKYQPAGFKLRLGLKDVRLALAAAEAVDAPLPFASVVRDHMLTAIGHGMEDMDWSSTAKLAAENAGLK
ncbi:MAG: NAD(P)-dependent oxidoreductase [Candidatus Korobacteraceae bacterium]|jgi:3-hydroxyisobutyrate dehydrogenase-like beta-hydroxyacid dehydrogenase